MASFTKRELVDNEEEPGPSSGKRTKLSPWLSTDESELLNAKEEIISLVSEYDDEPGESNRITI